MSGAFVSKFGQKPTVNPQPAAKRRVSGQTKANIGVNGQQMKVASGSTKDLTSKTNKSTFRSLRLRKKPSPIRPSSPQAADTESQPSNPVTETSDEDKTDINNDTTCVKEEIKVMPSEEKKEIERCTICLDDCTEPKELDKCGHQFCTECIDHYFQAVKPQCPCCFTIYGEIRGNQPDGTMKHTKIRTRLPGFEKNSSGTIQITYTFPNGIQNDKHPNPDMPYYGTTRDAYLPDNDQGRHVLKLLQKAFDLRQVFTVGQSRTTGYDNVVTWNDIHHKTNTHGGMENFGYPDKTYLNRVQQELAAKGIQ